jgi:hypothetical protein
VVIYLKVILFFAAVLASAAVGVAALWLADVVGTFERRSARVVAKLAGATSAGAVVVGAAIVGFQSVTWPGGLAVLWGVGQLVLLLAALGLGVVGFFTLLLS